MEGYNELHTNQRLLIDELFKRGIDVEVLDKNMELLKASYQEHDELILDRDSSIMPYSSSIVAGNKGLTKKLLMDANISVPIGITFKLEDYDYIIEAFKLFNRSVVIKPVFGSHGYDVYINLDSKEKVDYALNKIKASRGNTNILIEEYFEGKEYRIFITKNNDYAVLHREPAHVIGDGIHSIKELASIETNRRMTNRVNALCPILLDEEAELYLKNQQMDLDTIPSEYSKVYLRANSNVAMGGLCIDYTDKVHPSVIEIAKRVLKAIPGLPYAGIDFMSKDITIEQNPDIYNIIEVNTVPGIHMHMRPAMGEPRNVAKYIVDLMYPETVKEEYHEKRLVKHI